MKPILALIPIAVFSVFSASAFADDYDVSESGNLSISGYLSYEDHCNLVLDSQQQFEESEFNEEGLLFKPVEVEVTCLRRTAYELTTNDDPESFKSDYGEVTVTLLKSSCDNYGLIDNKETVVEAVAEPKETNKHEYCWVIDKVDGEYDGKVDTNIEVGLVTERL